ncbi:MAG: hypothetical protein LCH52_02350 [Bacteroidetes bacterium]|nr:hypothetical protein [Bacteroidota bacterium]
MEEKSKVEQFEEKLEEFFRNEDVQVTITHEFDEPAKELIEKLEPTPEERKEMKDILYDYEEAERDALEDMLIQELTEKVGRYGGNTNIVRDCVAYYRRHGYAEDSALETYADFAELPDDDEDIYWGNYFKFFPDAKIPEGMATYDYLKMQYEIRRERDHTFFVIDWFLMDVCYRIIELRFGKALSKDDIRTIYRANDFKNFYPEFIEAYKGAASASKEKSKEIAREYSKLQSKTKSTARRLLKITPELKIPEEVKRRIRGDSNP